MSPNAVGYDVDFGAALWQTPLSADLGLSDDDLHTVTLPFTLNYPGGSTNQVSFCTNGFVWLGNQSDTDYSPTIDELVNGAARFCPAWFDMNPTDGGSCHYDVVGGVAHFTWNNVPAYTFGTPGAGNTMQIAIYPDGKVDFRYRQLPNQPDDCIVGFTRGGTQTPPLTDFSNDLPATVSDDGTGISWTALNRPVTGSSQVLRIEDIPNPAQSIGLVVLGFSRIQNGLDLGAVGAPGCRLYAQSTTIEAITTPITGTSQVYVLPIPNVASLSGTIVTTQGVIIMPPTLNALGALTTNGVELKVGTQ